MIQPVVDRTYTIRQFADLAGVSVRTLHHYDRIGLLSPERNEAGYRLYTDQHLEILSQIIALKFIGVPLKEIANVLHRDRSGFARALAAQRTILEEKRKLLDRAIAAIGRTELSLKKGESVDAAGPTAQELATRWLELLAVFNKGAAIDAALMQASAFRVSTAKWPEGKQAFRNPAVWDFIGKALSVREIRGN